MNKQNVLIGLSLALGFVSALLAFNSFAQQPKESEFSYGVVAGMGGNELTVKEYDYAKDEEVPVPYVVSPAAELKGAPSLNAIAVDDNVDIIYETADGKRVAKFISVEKPSADNDSENSSEEANEPIGADGE